MNTKLIAAWTPASAAHPPPYINVSWHPDERVVRITVRDMAGTQVNVSMSKEQWLELMRDANNHTAAELIRQDT